MPPALTHVQGGCRSSLPTQNMIYGRDEAASSSLGQLVPFKNRATNRSDFANGRDGNHVPTQDIVIIVIG